MGLLDAFYDPNSAGLLAIGTGLLDASGPSRMPIGLGQALGGAMNRGVAAYQHAREIADSARMQSLQAQAMQESLNQARAMHPLQLQQLQSSIAQQAAQRKQAERSAADEDAAREWVKNFSNPTARFGQQSGSLAPTQQNADAFAAQPASAPGDLRDMVTGMARSMNPVLIAQAEKLKALLPKVKDYNQVMVNGQAVFQPMFEDGSMGTPGVNPVAKPLHFQNIGGQTLGLDAFTGKPSASFQNTISPDAAASNSLGWANNAISRQRLSFDQQQSVKPQFKDGYWVVPPQAGQATGQIIQTPLSTPPKGSPQANQQASARVLPLIDQAEALLTDSTHSYFGTGVDMAAQAFGKSTKGAQAAAKLKALEGSLMMAQPRMEGPQSDKDVALYRQMAGQIGDSTVPVETRRAALQTIRQLHEIYANGGVQSGTSKSGGVKFLGFE